MATTAYQSYLTPPPSTYVQPTIEDPYLSQQRDRQTQLDGQADAIFGQTYENTDQVNADQQKAFDQTYSRNEDLATQANTAFGQDYTNREIVNNENQKAFDQSYNERGQVFDQRQALFGTLQNALAGLKSPSTTGGSFSFGSTPSFSKFSSPTNFSASSGSPAPTPSTVSYPGGTNFAPPDISGAQHAAFGAAKGRAGLMARSSMGTLRSELAARGILGSGVEGRGLADRLAASDNVLSDENTRELSEGVGIAQHSQDLSAQARNAAYQGGVMQRGQDLQSRASDQANALSREEAAFNAQRGTYDENLKAQELAGNQWDSQQKLQLDAYNADQNRRMQQYQALQSMIMGLY